MTNLSARLREEKMYLREVERHFLRRRGSPLLLSPRDWAIAVVWFEEGVPLSFVLAGIDTVFERLEAEGKRRRARTLSYCRPAVEELWEERRHHLTRPPPGSIPDGVGADSGADGPAGAEILKRAADDLDRAAGRIDGPAGETLKSLSEGIVALAARFDAISEGSGGILPDQADSMERDREVQRLDREILEALEEAAAGDLLSKIESEAEGRLEPHRPHMSARAYRRTRSRAVENRIRRQYGVPRLALLLAS